MNPEYTVELDRVEKTFYTRHFLHKDEDTQQRKLYFRREVRASQCISFGIKPGEIFGLLGPNGAGKTTSVKMISGLVRPDAGRVFVDGLHVERKRLEALKRIGVVLEGTRTSIWPLTPYENLIYYGNLKGVKGCYLKDRARMLLNFIGLKEKTDVQVRRLSRGEKQKLAICIAMISDPKILLLDEPTTGLDVQSSRGIKDKIREITRDYGKSVLVTTHDMNVAQELCDRIGIIDRGQLITCKPTGELLHLFSDQSFEFHLDRRADPDSFLDIPGIHEASIQELPGGVFMLVLKIDPIPAARSEALFLVMDRIREGGFLLRSIQERQQNLESVFLDLTSTGSFGPARGKSKI